MHLQSCGEQMDTPVEVMMVVVVVVVVVVIIPYSYQYEHFNERKIFF